MTDDPEAVGPQSRVRPFLRSGLPVPGPAAAPEQPAPGTVRPFLVTSGRTVGAASIPLEAQVVTTTVGEGAHDRLTFEYRDIVRLCRQPVAVAEIAARLHLHLGVARVLVGDLQSDGLVTTFEPEPDTAHDVDTILRVIHGLRERS
jgi:hypothetical protein